MTPEIPGPFAPPAEPAEPEGPGWRVAAAFLLGRTFALATAPMVVGGIAAALDLPRAAVVRVALGALATWLPTSAVLFRVTFFPAPPDPDLHDDGRPVALSDLRAALRARTVEHALGVAPILLLVPLAFRLFPVALGALATLLVLGWFTWRERVAVASWLVREANLALVGWELDVATRRARLALAVGAGDTARMILAFAMFRGGDAAGALAALDQVADVAGFRVAYQRAWIGALTLPRPEVEAGLRALLADPAAAAWGHLLEALLAVADGRPLPDPRAVEEALAAVPDAEPRRMWRVLRAVADRSPDPLDPLDRRAARRLVLQFPALADRVGAAAGG